MTKPTGPVTPRCELCQYVGKPRPTAALAAFAMRQHECGNQHRRNARRARLGGRS